MAVKLHLSSGAQRVIENADGARLDGAFFLVTRCYRDLRRVETVLTLRAQDVVAAEVSENGIRTEYVRGGA
jgi:hypothetical protein